MPDDAQPASAQASVTVLVPASVEDRVVDWLLTDVEWRTEFSVHPVCARGPRVRLALSDERVHGFARWVEVRLIVKRPRLDSLVAALEGVLAGVEGGYWVQPVERFSGFGRGGAGPNREP